MRQIKVQKLTKKGFQKYGVFQNLLDSKTLSEKSIFSVGFFADLITLDFSGSTLPTISVCHVKKQEKNIVKFLEAHQYTCEGLLPLDADVIIFVGTPGYQGLSVETLEAFYVPAGTFVKLDPLIVHGTQYVVHKEEAHIVCMLPGRTFKNDMIAQPLTSQEEMAEIIYEYEEE